MHFLLTLTLKKYKNKKQVRSAENKNKNNNNNKKDCIIMASIFNRQQRDCNKNTAKNEVKNNKITIKTTSEKRENWQVDN